MQLATGQTTFMLKIKVNNKIGFDDKLLSHWWLQNKVIGEKTQRKKLQKPGFAHNLAGFSANLIR